MKIGATTVLVLIFLTLKLTDTIDWSWWWVFSPYWILALVLIFILWVGTMIVWAMGR